MLSGQHSSLAAKELGEEMDRVGRERPRWACCVLATALSHDCPLYLRQTAAGRAQASQESVAHLRLGRVAAILLRLLEDNPKEELSELLHSALLMGAQKECADRVCIHLLRICADPLPSHRPRSGSNGDSGPSSSNPPGTSASRS